MYLVSIVVEVLEHDANFIEIVRVWRKHEKSQSGGKHKICKRYRGRIWTD